MGDFLSKYSDATLLMKTNKAYYFAGQRIEGHIYLDVRNATSNYSSLHLRLQGTEQSKSSLGDALRIKKLITYEYQQLLVNFKDGIAKGQICFPFQILLPNSLTGTFNFKNKCLIKYTLIARLNKNTDQIGSLYYQIPINIIEPPRISLASIQITTRLQINNQCCQFFIFNDGNVSINLKCDKNNVMTGDNVMISGEIDNKNGKVKIKNWKIVLQEFIVINSKNNQVRTKLENVYLLEQSKPKLDQILPGYSQLFETKTIVPKQINNSTAIGVSMGRCYTFSIYLQSKCFQDTLKASLPIYLQSCSPKFTEPPNIALPQNWNPFVYPKFQMYNLHPFSCLGSRMPKIYLNRQQQIDRIDSIVQDRLMSKASCRDDKTTDKQKSSLKSIFPHSLSENYYVSQTMRSDICKRQVWFKSRGIQPYFCYELSAKELASVI